MIPLIRHMKNADYRLRKDLAAIIFQQVCRSNYGKHDLCFVMPKAKFVAYSLALGSNKRGASLCHIEQTAASAAIRSIV